MPPPFCHQRRPSQPWPGHSSPWWTTWSSCSSPCLWHWRVGRWRGWCSCCAWRSLGRRGGGERDGNMEVSKCRRMLVWGWTWGLAGASIQVGLQKPGRGTARTRRSTHRFRSHLSGVSFPDSAHGHCLNNPEGRDDRRKESSGTLCWESIRLLDPESLMFSAFRLSNLKKNGI